MILGGFKRHMGRGREMYPKVNRERRKKELFLINLNGRKFNTLYYPHFPTEGNNQYHIESDITYHKGHFSPEKLMLESLRTIFTRSDTHNAAFLKSLEDKEQVNAISSSQQ